MLSYSDVWAQRMRSRSSAQRKDRILRCVGCSGLEVSCLYTDNYGQSNISRHHHRRVITRNCLAFEDVVEALLILQGNVSIWALAELGKLTSYGSFFRVRNEGTEPSF